MRHIAILGIDGAGKTTLATKLSKMLTNMGSISVIKSRRKVLGSLVYDALGLTKEIENERQVSFEDAVAFCTAMYLDFVEDFMQIISQKNSMELVIWDRHVRCLSAYARTLSLPINWALHMETVVASPDLSFWLDTPVITAYSRLCARREGGARETLSYLDALRTSYEELCVGDSRIIRLDGATEHNEALIDQTMQIIRTRIITTPVQG